MNLQNKYFIWTITEHIDQVEYALHELETVAEWTKLLFSSVDYDLGRIDLVVPIRYEYYYPELSFT